MDLPRPNAARDRRRRRIIATTVAVVLIALVTIGLGQLKPALPSVDGGLVYRDVVKRGSMLRAVRGNGTLVPEQIQYVQSETDGRVERILVLPGALVEPDTVILELSNEELKQTVFDLEWQLKAAEAQLIRLKVQLQSERLTQEAAVATLQSELAQSEIEAVADEELLKSGLVAPLTAKRTRARADELANRHRIELERLKISAESATAQLDVQKADMEKLKASGNLKRNQVAALHVRAGIKGVLKQIGDRETLRVGQRISPSITLAKIVQPTRLKAEIKIVETQATELQNGLKAVINTRNGEIPGEVMRVDPASQNGTRTVDIKLLGPLPRGAVPDLTVDGTIEIERLENVLYVGVPFNGHSESTVGLFKVVEGGKEAYRTQVKLGRSSVSVIEVIEGLAEGDVIIVGDMANYDAHDRVRIN